MQKFEELGYSGLKKKASVDWFFFEKLHTVHTRSAPLSPKNCLIPRVQFLIPISYAHSVQTLRTHTHGEFSMKSFIKNKVHKVY